MKKKIADALASFKTSQLGYAALSKVQAVGSEGNEMILLKKTDELKALIKEQAARGAELEVGDKINDEVSPMNMQEAIDNYIADDENRDALTGQLIVDKIIVHADKDKTGDVVLDINVALAKAAGSMTQSVRTGTLTSFRLTSIATERKTNSTSDIDDNLRRTNLPTFSVRVEDSDEEAVVKRVSVYDLDVPFLLDMSNLIDPEGLTLLIKVARFFEEELNIKALKAFAEEQVVNDAAYLVALRVKNAGLADSIFKDEYEKYYGSVDINDANSVEHFKNMKSRYKSRISEIGDANNLSPHMLQFGFKGIDIKTSRNVKVTNIDKRSKMKTNLVGSCFYPFNRDTGIYNAICTKEDREKFLNLIAPHWLELAAKWAVNEQMHFLHIEGECGLTDEDKAKLNSIIGETKQMKVHEALGIDPERAKDLKLRLVTELKEHAARVIKDARADRAVAASEGLSRFQV